MQVLVAVSSRHGGTRELGHQVAQALAARGHEVDQIEPDDVEHVQRYDAVVLGTSVYVGRAGLDLKDLVERQGASLRDRPVWLFWSGPATDEAARVGTPEDVEQVAREVRATATRVFGGRVQPEALSITERSLVALVPVEPGDHRDLSAAYAWGEEIASTLT